MTIVSVDPSLEAAMTQAGALAELLVTALLVAIILEREMVRGKAVAWLVASGPALFAIAIPLGFAWLAVTVQQVMLFLSR